MVGGVHCAIAYAAGVADCQSGAGRRAAGVGAVFTAGGALAVYVAMLKCDGLEGVAQVFSYLPGCCAFTCPGKLPLVEQFRKGKGMLRTAMAEKKAKEEKK